MGINGLTPFLKKFAPDAFTSVCLSEFAHKKIAVDISLYLYKCKAVYGDEQWMAGILQMMTVMRSHSIHPIVVFDGDAPAEKLEEQQTRRAARSDRLGKYNALVSNMSQYRRDGTVSPDLQEFHNKHARRYGSAGEFDAELVERHLEKLKGQTMRVLYSDITKTQELVRTLRIPYFQAPGEAEGMCSWLARHKLVDAVMTDDTDVLAYGAPKFLCKLNTSAGTCVQVDYARILTQLGLSETQFTDFCIACGCDYNRRVPGMGPVKAYKLIKKHGSIDAMGTDASIDTSPLKHIRVRSMFTQPCKDTIGQYARVEKMWCRAPVYDEILAFMRKNTCVMYCHPQHVYNCCMQDAKQGDCEDDSSGSDQPARAYKKRTSPSMKT